MRLTDDASATVQPHPLRLMFAWAAALALLVVELLVLFVGVMVVDESQYAAEMRERFTKPLSLASLCDVAALAWLTWIGWKALKLSFRTAGRVGHLLAGDEAE